MEKHSVYAKCKNDHIWGDGKTVILADPCPECHEDCIILVRKLIVEVDKNNFKGIMYSKGE